MSVPIRESIAGAALFSLRAGGPRSEAPEAGGRQRGLLEALTCWMAARRRFELFTNPRDWSWLIELRLHEMDDRPFGLGDISLLGGFSYPSARRIAREFVDAGLLESAHDGRDKRATRFTFTARGRRMFDEYLEYLCTVLGTLPQPF